MWTPAARAQLVRKATPYATCSSDAEWALLAPFLPPPAATGRPRSWPTRQIMDGMLYLLRTGCAWAHLPRDFPPPGTVHRWFLRLARAGVFERMMDALVVFPAPAGMNRFGSASFWCEMMSNLEVCCCPRAALGVPYSPRAAWRRSRSAIVQAMRLRLAVTIPQPIQRPILASP